MTSFIYKKFKPLHLLILNWSKLSTSNHINRSYSKLKSLPYVTSKSKIWLPYLSTVRYKSNKPDIDLDEPIKFSTSKAAKWKSEELFYTSVNEDPELKPPWKHPAQSSLFIKKEKCFKNSQYVTSLLEVHPFNNQRRYFSKLTKLLKSKPSQATNQMAVSFSMAIFFLYFFWYRENSDIDEELSQPIWKRVPGIPPEHVERMIEMDKYLGLQVDLKGFEQYKKDYYLKQIEDYHSKKE